VLRPDGNGVHEATHLQHEARLEARQVGRGEERRLRERGGVRVAQGRLRHLVWDDQRRDALRAAAGAGSAHGTRVLRLDGDTVQETQLQHRLEARHVGRGHERRFR